GPHDGEARHETAVRQGGGMALPRPLRHGQIHISDPRRLPAESAPTHQPNPLSSATPLSTSRFMDGVKGMWRLTIVSMGFLSLVLSACDQSLFTDSDRYGNGDYEVVALIAE